MADTPDTNDLLPVYSHLVSKPEAFTDPTDDDSNTLRAFRFMRKSDDNPNDSDLDLEGARDMASYRKRKLVGAAAVALSDLLRAKAQKAKANAKILAEGGILPDNADDDSSVEGSTISDKDDGAAMSVDTGNLTHLLLQGQMIPTSADPEPPSPEDEEGENVMPPGNYTSFDDLNEDNN